ncbi:MAG: ABC transporter ATP-binding protein, partial [Limnobacter sp.]|nr:ABC transporter ATP-binding protein [Limnobacter sp.]
MSIRQTSDGFEGHFESASPFPLKGSIRGRAGEILALVGPSGAGKTTLLRAMAGLASNVQGQIRVFDDVWLDSSKGKCLPAQRRSVGFVFQQYALMPHLSALDNVRMAIRHLNPSASRSAARQHLLEMGLTEKQTMMKPHALSGGQQQRVALARALAGQPKILLLDEPFSATDQTTRQRLYEILARLRRELHIPIVLVTHDLNEARQLADAMAVMYGGEIIQSGDTQTVYSKPKTRKVADLIGIQNRFSGLWLGVDEDRAELGHLRWHKTLKPDDLNQTDGPVLLVKNKGTLSGGRRVNWVVPNDALYLSHEKTSFEGATSFLQLPVQIKACKNLGEITLIEATLQTPPGRVLRLTMTGPKRTSFQEGQQAWVALDQSQIHIMP